MKTRDADWHLTWVRGVAVINARVSQPKHCYAKTLSHPSASVTQEVNLVPVKGVGALWLTRQQQVVGLPMHPQRLSGDSLRGKVNTARPQRVDL